MTCTMHERSVATALGVKALETRARIRVCSGGSMSRRIRVWFRRGCDQRCRSAGDPAVPGQDPGVDQAHTVNGINLAQAAIGVVGICAHLRRCEVVGDAGLSSFPSQQCTDGERPDQRLDGTCDQPHGCMVNRRRPACTLLYWATVSASAAGAAVESAIRATHRNRGRGSLRHQKTSVLWLRN